MIGNIKPYEHDTIIKDLISAADAVMNKSYFSSGRMDIDGFKNLFTGLSQLLKMVSDPAYEKTPYGIIKSVAKGASQLTGILI